MPWTNDGTFVEWFPNGRLDPEFIVSGFFPKYSEVPDGRGHACPLQNISEISSDRALKFAEYMRLAAELRD